MPSRVSPDRSCCLLHGACCTLSVACRTSIRLVGCLQTGHIAGRVIDGSTATPVPAVKVRLPRGIVLCGMHTPTCAASRVSAWDALPRGQGPLVMYLPACSPVVHSVAIAFPEQVVVMRANSETPFLTTSTGRNGRYAPALAGTAAGATEDSSNGPFLHLSRPAKLGQYPLTRSRLVLTGA